MYLFLTVPSLHCYLACSLAAPSGSCSLVVRCRLLISAASLVEHRFQGRPASAAVGSSQIRDPAQVSCLGRRLLTQCATQEVHVPRNIIILFALFWGFFLVGGFQPLENVKIIFSSQDAWVEIRFSQQAPLNHFKATAAPGRGATEMIALQMQSLGVLSDGRESASQERRAGDTCPPLRPASAAASGLLETVCPVHSSTVSLPGRTHHC